MPPGPCHSSEASAWRLAAVRIWNFNRAPCGSSPSQKRLTGRPLRGAGAGVADAAEAAEVFNNNLKSEGLPGHGKPGGVRLAKSADEAAEIAGSILGNILVTKQTGEQGKRVQRVLIEEGCDIAEELYLSILLDRSLGRVVG